jgi:hypothetical protein
MTTITYGTAIPATAPVQRPAPTAKRLSLFARFMAARQLQAEAELRRHGLRLPRELEDAGLKLNSRNEDSLPFVR